MNESITITDVTPSGSFFTTYLSKYFKVCCNKKASYIQLNLDCATDFEINLLGDYTDIIKYDQDCFKIILLAEKMDRFIYLISEHNRIKGREELKSEFRKLLV